MIFLVIFLGLSLLTTSFFLYYSVKKNLQFLDEQDEILELLEDSITNLEICYQKIDKKARLELFSDDAIVKDLVLDVKKTREILKFAIEELTNEKDIIKNVQNIEGDDA